MPINETVLYIHGLESGPQGRKPRHLAEAGFVVVSRLMPCARSAIVRDPAVLALAACAAALVAASAIRGGIRGLALGVGIAGAAAPFIESRIMRRVLQRSVDVQLRALAAHQIDVVVGSSFGGAVALDLLARGAWSGRTLLLCPAHELVARRGRMPMPPSLATLPDAVSSRVIVVHGRGDDTVPVTHSEELVAGSPARLILVDDDHRLVKTATPEQLAAWIASTSS